MGARVIVFNRRKVGGELIGDLEVHSAELTATDVTEEEVPRLVDELPLFALAAGVARGVSHVTGAGELRLKESDRIETVTEGLKTMGVRIQSRRRWFRGERRACTSDRRPDAVGRRPPHRDAWCGHRRRFPRRSGVEGAEAVAISFPGFFDLLNSVSRR